MALTTLLALGSLVVAAPAVGAGPAVLAATITTSTPTVVSGGLATWSVAWSCTDTTTGACDNAVLTVPVPVASPNGISPLYNCAVSGDAGGRTTSAAIVGAGGNGSGGTQGGTAVWTFAPTIPTGSSGNFSLECSTVNRQTPNNETFTPLGSFTADNANTVAVTGATVTVTAVLELSTSLQLFSGGVPNLDSTVGYRLNLATLGGTSGNFTPSNLDITVTIPATARYVATGPDYASGIVPVVTSGPGGFGGTITWTGTGGYRIDQIYFYLEWPSSVNADTSTVTVSTSVTANSPFMPSRTVTATTSHGFQALGSNTPSFTVTKSPSIGNLTRGGSAQALWSGSLGNPGSADVNFSFTDHLPCSYVSSWSAGGPCAASDLLVRVTSLSTNTQTLFPLAVSARTSDNRTLTGTIPFSPTLISGEFISDFTISGRLIPNEYALIYIPGIAAVSIPTAAPALTPYRVAANSSAVNQVPIENCLDMDGGDATASAVGTGAPITLAAFNPATHCATVNIIPSTTQWSLFATSANTVVAPGDRVDFSASILRHQLTAASSPVFASLLPAGLDFVSGSFSIFDNSAVAAWAGPPPGGLTAWAVTPTVIPNYLGTGRTLVRATWPAPRVLAEGESVSMTFKGQVAAGASPGIRTLQLSGFDGTTSTTSGLCYNGVDTVDLLDLNGNSNTSEVRCQASADYTVVAGGAVNVASLVKGSSDLLFVGSPAVGRTVPGATAFYRTDVQNQGNVALKNIVSYMIMPRVGDTGVSAGLVGTARGSQWNPTLSSVTVPAGSTVQYSSSTNPCRGEVFTAGGLLASAPSGCVDDWSSVAPSPLSSVKALRLVTAGPVAVGDSNRFVIEVDTPAGAVGIAYNSFATSAQRADNDSFLQPAETARVGIEAAPVLIDKTVVSGPTDNGDGSQSIQYQIDVENTGTTAASYSLADTPLFAAGSTVVSRAADNSVPGTIATLPGFDAQTTNNIVTGQTIGAGLTHTYLIDVTVRVPALANSAGADCTLASGETGTGLLNRASVTVGTAVGVSEACEVPLAGRLQIAKTVDDTSAKPGDRLEYTVRVENTGSMEARNLVVEDTMPAGLKYVSSSDSGVATGQVVRWSISSLDAGGSATFTVIATIDSLFAGARIDNSLGVVAPLGFADSDVVDPCSSDPSLACASTLLPQLAGPAGLALTGANLQAPLLGGFSLICLGILAVFVRRMRKIR